MVHENMERGFVVGSAFIRIEWAFKSANIQAMVPRLYPASSATVPKGFQCQLTLKRPGNIFQKIIFFVQKSFPMTVLMLYETGPMR